MPPLRTGDIFWLDGCPPLDGDEAKRRPVVVVDDADALHDGADPVVVVAITTAECREYDRVDLPNLQDQPGTTTGLPRPCCAVPRWILHIDRANLTERCGHLPKVTLERLSEAIELRLDDPDTQGVMGA